MTPAENDNRDATSLIVKRLIVKRIVLRSQSGCAFDKKSVTGLY